MFIKRISFECARVWARRVFYKNYFTWPIGLRKDGIKAREDRSVRSMTDYYRHVDLVLSCCGGEDFQECVAMILCRRFGENAPLLDLFHQHRQCSLQRLVAQIVN
jgi:hypothetical protein